MSAALAVVGIGCARGGRMLFEALSFRIEPGGALLVTGPNGAGKSSLLRALAGLLPVTGGTIARPARVALMAEAAALDGARRLAQALGFWARLDGKPDPDARVAAALEEVSLVALADVPVRLLSTGQRRRAALAATIARGADLWLLDEPATGLDMAAVARLEAIVARHRAGGGIAVVATHQPLALPGAATVAL